MCIRDSPSPWFKVWIFAIQSLCRFDLTNVYPSQCLNNYILSSSFYYICVILSGTSPLTLCPSIILSIRMLIGVVHDQPYCFSFLRWSLFSGSLLKNSIFLPNKNLWDFFQIKCYVGLYSVTSCIFCHIDLQILKYIFESFVALTILRINLL